jgi:hypothetical protein
VSRHEALFQPAFSRNLLGCPERVFVTTVFGGLTAKRHRFDEIDVHRINVVEADGTLRMVLSNKTRLPGIIVKGKEYAHEDRKTAGILFFDDEGTENGGLIFGGMRGKDGKVESWGHLSFDQYMQDQVFTVDAREENGQRRSGIGIWERGNYPLIDLIEASMRIEKLPHSQQESEWDKFSRRILVTPNVLIWGESRIAQ